MYIFVLCLDQDKQFPTITFNCNHGNGALMFTHLYNAEGSAGFFTNIFCFSSQTGGGQTNLKIYNIYCLNFNNVILWATYVVMPQIKKKKIF